MFGTVSRPTAAAIAAGAAFTHLDPSAIAGIIVGAPTALAFSAARTAARAATTSMSRSRPPLW
ncbi:hypothetical protein [Rhodococcus sp. NPDC059234]|uniref:hypothetical protein n=1 Tax=Rhodococcus sp. NPDC059234 TaxID=3346781 RepID=UPI003670737A